MKHTKNIVFALIVLLSLNVFLPAVSAHSVPMVRFAGNASGQALVLCTTSGDTASFSDVIFNGTGMFSVMGQANLPDGTDFVAVDMSNFLLRENRLFVNFGGQIINVRFGVEQVSSSILWDIAPDMMDSFFLGDLGFYFYGTFRNASGTYSVGGRALIESIPLVNPQTNLDMRAILIVLEGSDGLFFAEVFWVSESIVLDASPDGTITLPAAAVLGSSVDFTFA